MEKRLILFLILSAAIFWGWTYIYGKLNPLPPKPVAEQTQLADASPSPTGTTTIAAQSQPEAAAPSVAPATQVESRQFKLKSDHWTALFSNQGAVINEWTMTSFTDGKPIDPPQGVTLISPKLSQEIGGTFRFHIPSDATLEKELNSARYEVKNLPGSDAEVSLAKGEQRDITFYYANNGIEASKSFIFKGAGAANSSGFDFDLLASVKRNGNPVDAYLVLGPNFGDQHVTNVSTYKHAPRLSYAIGSSVTHKTADDLKTPGTHPASGQIVWAAVDDNYFALAIAPTRPVNALGVLDGKYVSMAVQFNQGETNHVYAGPKDLSLLQPVSQHFGLAQKGSQLEDIVSYGILDFLRGLIKPIAQFMLKALRAINQYTHNFGWSIVILTIALNMLFFPLRWRSSVAMKRAAAMQPKMKDLQEKMKKLDKNDPRMLDLQKEQIALMKEGNPLMGCLPLVLQMPFFMAVFAILTVSIEVRNAPFFGWLTDLSSPDPYYVLPIVMCITMIAQTALTPMTGDPMQKRVQYLMPPILTYFFFRTAPAGLVLYWMVSNLVGVVQQFIINKLNPPNKPATDASQKDNPNAAKGKKAKTALANS